MRLVGDYWQASYLMLWDYDGDAAACVDFPVRLHLNCETSQYIVKYNDAFEYDINFTYTS